MQDVVHFTFFDSNFDYFDFVVGVGGVGCQEATSVGRRGGGDI
jgi:hypothetical protein